MTLGALASALSGALAGWLLGAGLVPFGGAAPAAIPSPSATTAVEAFSAPAASAPAVDVLREWDVSRARAYTEGDAKTLRSLYSAGSVAGTTDVRLLRAYAGRGLRVEGMRMQILAVDVLGHSEGRLRLRVTDRLDGAVAVGNGARVALPRDQASTRVVTLFLRGGAWRVAAVR